MITSLPVRFPVEFIRKFRFLRSMSFVFGFVFGYGVLESRISFRVLVLVLLLSLILYTYETLTLWKTRVKGDSMAPRYVSCVGIAVIACLLFWNSFEYGSVMDWYAAELRFVGISLLVTLGFSSLASANLYREPERLFASFEMLVQMSSAGNGSGTAAPAPEEAEYEVIDSKVNN